MESEDFGHTYVTQNMKKERVLQMGSDKIIPRYVYDKPFTTRFPDRIGKRGSGFLDHGEGRLIWYTDGSKTNKDTGAGVYCDGTRRNLGLALGRTQQYSRQKCMPLRRA
jgi:hypothetical protein